MKNAPSRHGYDHHFLLPSSHSGTEFFGSSSAFSLAVEVLTHAHRSPLLGDSFPYVNEQDDSISDGGGSYVVHIPTSTGLSLNVSKETIASLLSIYRASLNTMYTFFLDSTITADLNDYSRIIGTADFDATQLVDLEAFRYFRVNMMCALTCAIKSRYSQSLAGLGDSFANEALKCVEEVTSEASSKSLQTLLLLIQYCLFYPRKGDIWKLLDFACRLSVELGYHTEQDMMDASVEDRELRRSTFWGLYAIERIVGQLFGRPSDLPESIITTEYPSKAASLPQDPISAQGIFSAHHYRLVYLRSEIYREIYLPATMPVRSNDWLKGRYSLLLQWWKDATVEDDRGNQYPGVGRVTCTVAYHSTIIFLLQPMMLRALSNEEVNCIPRDNYVSAVKLIETYEGVLQAPDDSAVGIYPMTFMSAHYICLAALTLLAHWMLFLDGHVVTSNLLEGYENAMIDYSTAQALSASCLILLSWCAERWPGMEGTLNIFQKLSEKLLPELSRHG